MVNMPEAMNMRQLWHTPLNLMSGVRIVGKNARGEKIVPVKQEGWYSSLYAQKEQTEECAIGSISEFIDTIITIGEAESKELILRDIQEAVECMRLVKEGKLSPKPARDLLDEL